MSALAILVLTVLLLVVVFGIPAWVLFMTDKDVKEFHGKEE